MSSKSRGGSFNVNEHATHSFGVSDLAFASESSLRPTSVGLVHDWLAVYADAERVLEQMIRAFPDSSLYSLVDFIPEADRGFLEGRPVETSFLQHLPFSRWLYRRYLPLAPLAIEQLDVTEHDVVISSSYAVAKGVLTRADQLHISYVHSPVRDASDLYSDYMNGRGGVRGGQSMWARLLLHYMRLYDVNTAPRVDVFVANSRHVARRIWRAYRRPAHVIYPPVDTDRFTMKEKKQNYYLTYSRLVSTQRVDLIVRAFTEMPDKELIVIGDGPEYHSIRRGAGPNVTFLGAQGEEAISHYLANARAAVFAAEEDFGVAPVEAQACGTPVIAFGRGGALESVRAGITGVFFPEQTVEHLKQAVTGFEKIRSQLDPKAIREHAETFSVSAFRESFSQLVHWAYGRFVDSHYVSEGDSPSRHLPKHSSRKSTRS